MKTTVTIDYASYELNLLKYAELSTGYGVRLYQADTASCIFKYLVTIINPHGEIVEKKRFFPSDKKSAPFTFYLDCICCYA